MTAEILGWIGFAAFMICNLPQAFLIYKQGHAKGLHIHTIMLYLTACSLSLIYALNAVAPTLIFNFSTTLILWLVIAWYKIHPRGDKKG